ncbi:uncharacterized protein TRAVEDRAFT_43757 [Trametes versicolor FP-101664 SS1]|uniref:uncharacterized protein n=1 Tax=Trametes versicolor (strain FP-101664) TaxID=717944 RepID=UPI0004624293|nr:uncharacterized protein TRAVEDRAFT_43757 [Trametes versicolor FP-101664 SS1]EIW63463.1 hypothetical protein TRAVEDRAFT_43757 [Trametes versicolor FP-101664 SS1]
MPPRKKQKDGAAVHADEAPGAAPKTVATVKPKRAIRGRRGFLKDIPNLPLDVLLEASFFLHPRDLLSIARANKALRAVLMDRKHAYCWKAARAQLGDEYPETPLYLSEPAYADLLFFHHCYNCKKTNIRTVYWVFSARYCKPCFAAMTCSYPKELVKEVRDALEDLSESPFLNSLWNDYRVRDPRHELLVHKPELETFEKTWKALSAVADKRKFIEELQTRVEAARATHRKLYGRSELARQDTRSGMKSQRDARLKAIMYQLRSDGWKEELEFMKKEKKMEVLSKHKAVFKQDMLTDDEWASIRDEVVAVVEPFREALEQSVERKELFEDRVQDLKAAYDDHMRTDDGYTRRRRRILASEQVALVCDLAYRPEIRSLIEAASDEEIDEDTFKPLIQNSMDKWAAEQKAVFEKEARRGLKNLKNPAAQAPDILDLAIVSFHCTDKQCVSPWPLRWPEVLAHPCLRPNPWRSIDDLEAGPDFDCVVCWEAESEGFPFKAGDKQVCFNKHVKEVREVISCCEEDPATVLYKTMEECPVRLMCGRCAKPDRREVFDWLGAAAHAVDHHKSSYTDWTRDALARGEPL